MEHVPIKKRRFFLRSPSPTPQSPKHCKESQKPDSGMRSLEQQTYVKGNTEQEAALNDFSGSLCKKLVMDGDVQNAASSFKGEPISNEDLTGTAIVATAACSGVDRNKMGDLPKSDDNETLDSTANVTEDESNTTTDDGLSQIMVLSGSEPNELIVSEVSRVKTIECCELPGTTNNVVLPAETIPFNSPNKDVETTGNTTETSDAPRNHRLHWDLNTIMDDWNHQVDDTFAGSCMTSAEVAQNSAMSIQKSVHVETFTSRETAVAIGGDTLGGQSIAYVMPESKTGSDMSISSLDLSSDHVTSRLKGISSVHGTNCCAIEKDNVSNAEGYDGNLEDGELRESVGHGWEDKEIEDAETEHVDYDSDDREGIFLEAAKDSVRLWGEVLAGDCEKQKFTFDKRVEDDCSQHQSCFSTHDQESPSLKPFFGAQRDCKGYGRSNSETDRLGKDFSAGALRDSRDGRRMPSSDRRSADSIRSRSWNLGSEGRDRTTGISEDTSFRVCRPRMISTSRSGYNPTRKGSPGERDDFHDKRMVSGRDINSDKNSRSKFDRFSGGINRGFKEGYHRQGMPNNFGKRERSFSPRENRLVSHYPRSQQKYGSRPRSRSPEFRSEARMGRERLPYQPPGHSANHIRERSPGRNFNQRPRFNAMSSPRRLRSNDGPISDPDYEETDEYRRKPRFAHSNRRSQSRSRSFSPDFRSDARAGPMRPPYQPTRGRGRGRRSFVRGFRQDQRYDNGESRGRFSDNPQSGRGNAYCNGGDEYRRKPQNIFERIQPVSHYDKDGDGRQFQYNERFNLNRNFRRNESYSRGGYKRAGDFRKEERCDLIYDSDRMFYSGPKQFGDGTPSSKAYSSECEYLKNTEEQLKASPAIQQDVTPSLQENRVEPVSQSQTQPTIASSSPENPLDPESSVREITTATPSVGLISGP